MPEWYRQKVGEEGELAEKKWQTDPEDPRYVRHFGGMIRALGRRYDGHPDLESVDMALVGAWGEGAGSALLSQETREALVDAYLEAFQKTPLLMLLTDEKTNHYGISKKEVGWRVDCLGDMGGFSKTWLLRSWSRSALLGLLVDFIFVPVPRFRATRMSRPRWPLGQRSVSSIWISPS